MCALARWRRSLWSEGIPRKCTVCWSRKSRHSASGRRTLQLRSIRRRCSDGEAPPVALERGRYSMRGSSSANHTQNQPHCLIEGNDESGNRRGPKPQTCAQKLRGRKNLRGGMPQFHAGENRQKRRVVLQGGICEGNGVLSSGGSEMLQFGRTNRGAMTRGMVHIQSRTRAQCH